MVGKLFTYVHFHSLCSSNSYWLHILICQWYTWYHKTILIIKVCRQRRKTFLLLYRLFFIFIIFLFLSHYLRSAISLPFVIGSFSNLASWWIITCTSAVYIYGCEGQRSRSQGDTRWKCTVSRKCGQCYNLQMARYC